MDAALLDALMRKIAEIDAASERVAEMGGRLGADGCGASPQDAFERGVAAGRLYNSFHYQCRRILKRDPTDGEFDEFIGIVQDNAARLLGRRA